MAARVLLAIFLFVVATSSKDEGDAEDFKPITAAQFNEKYNAYLGSIEECNKKEEGIKACVDEENTKFRPITNRAVQSEVIEEKSCNKGRFGKFNMIVDGKDVDVDLPC